MSTIYSKLIQIPHLNLTPYLPKVPLKDMLKDLNQFNDTDYFSYKTATKNKQFLEFLGKNWKGMCLIDSTEDGRQHNDYYTSKVNADILKHNFKDDKVIFQPTNVGKLCPHMTKYCYDVAKRPQRTRLSRLVVNGNFHWHSHKVLAEAATADKRFTNKTGKYEKTLIIHIVLKTNDKCWMGVSNQHPMGGHPFEIYKQHYGLGEVWILNGHYYHNVFNSGTTTREHIMLYANIDDEKLNPILEKAIDEYDGPIIADEIIPQRITGSFNLNHETGLPLDRL